MSLNLLFPLATECQKLNLLLTDERNEIFTGVDLQIPVITTLKALSTRETVLFARKLEMLKLTMKQLKRRAIFDVSLTSQRVSYDCYGLPVRLPYIVITCARIDSIKRVCSEPPCCPVVFSELSSVHDNFGDKDGILRDILRRESEDIPKQDAHDVLRCQTSLMRHQNRFVTSGKFRSSQWELTSRRMRNS